MLSCNDCDAVCLTKCTWRGGKCILFSYQRWTAYDQYKKNYLFLDNDLDLKISSKVKRFWTLIEMFTSMLMLTSTQWLQQRINMILNFDKEHCWQLWSEIWYLRWYLKLRNLFDDVHNWIFALLKCRNVDLDIEDHRIIQHINRFQSIEMSTRQQRLESRKSQREWNKQVRPLHLNMFTWNRCWKLF